LTHGNVGVAFPQLVLCCFVPYFVIDIFIVVRPLS